MKIKAVMDLLVQNMGIDPSVSVKRQQIISFGLKKRIAPRCLVRFGSPESWPTRNLASKDAGISGKTVP